MGGRISTLHVKMNKFELIFLKNLFSCGIIK